MAKSASKAEHRPIQQPTPIASVWPTTHPARLPAPAHRSLIKIVRIEAIYGTYLYVAPEQILQGAIGPLIDL